MIDIKKPYNPIYIANYIIAYCTEKDLELNNLKLQKILYFLQAQSLVETGVPLFKEPLQKWKYGPVVPSVYHEYKKRGASNLSCSDIGPILREPLENEEPNFFDIYVIEDFDRNFISSNDKMQLNESIGKLAKYNPFSLVQETHQHNIWKTSELEINRGVQGLEYSEEEITEYFTKNPEKQLWKK